MVKELSDKHLAAINRGRKAVGLKAIRRNKKTSTNKKIIDDNVKGFTEYKKGVIHGSVGGIDQKDMKRWLIETIKTRERNPKNYSSDYSRGELRGYKEALKQLKKKR